MIGLCPAAVRRKRDRVFPAVPLCPGSERLPPPHTSASERNRLPGRQLGRVDLGDRFSRALLGCLGWSRSRWRNPRSR